MFYERDTIRPMRELEHEVPAKHQHERPVEDQDESIEFTPGEARALKALYGNLRHRDARLYVASDHEATMVLGALGKLVTGMHHAGY